MKGVKYHVLHRGKISGILVQSGASQCCILSPILFLLVIGDILHFDSYGGRGGVQGTTSFLKHPDYADDICLLSHRVMNPGRMVPDLERKASRVGLKTNTNKTKILSLMGHRTPPIHINGRSIESIDQFIYLGGVVSTNSGTELHVARSINSARFTFAALSKILECNYLSTKIKLRLFCTIVGIWE